MGPRRCESPEPLLAGHEAEVGFELMRVGEAPGVIDSGEEGGGGDHDGMNQVDFLLGKQEKSNRDSVVVSCRQRPSRREVAELEDDVQGYGRRRRLGQETLASSLPERDACGSSSPR
jgi:hypothetical protein